MIRREPILQNSQGFSLTEIIMSMAILIIILMNLLSYISSSGEISARTTKEIEAQSDLSLMKSTLFQAVPKLFYGDIFLNAETLSALVGPSLTMTFDKPQYYSILPIRSQAFTTVPKTGIAPAFTPTTPDFTMVLMFGPHETDGLEVLENPLTPGAPYDFTDPALTTGTLSVTGNTSKYKIGDLIAITADIGTEIVRVAALTPGSLSFVTIGTYDINGVTTNFPLALVDKGARIAKIDVFYIGVDMEKAYPVILRNVAGENSYLMTNVLPQPATSVQVIDTTKKTNSYQDVAPLSVRSYLYIKINTQGILLFARKANELKFLF
jgi:type II secretory pathway pseudopilin PulG